MKVRCHGTIRASGVVGWVVGRNVFGIEEFFGGGVVGCGDGIEVMGRAIIG